MMSLVAFDVAVPVVTTAALECGGQKFSAGVVFPWREAGVTELELHTMWRAGIVAFQPAPAPKPKQPQQPRR